MDVKLFEEYETPVIECRIKLPEIIAFHSRGCGLSLGCWVQSEQTIFGYPTKIDDCLWNALCDLQRTGTAAELAERPRLDYDPETGISRYIITAIGPRRKLTLEDLNRMYPEIAINTCMHRYGLHVKTDGTVKIPGALKPQQNCIARVSSRSYRMFITYLDQE